MLSVSGGGERVAGLKDREKVRGDERLRKLTKILFQEAGYIMNIGVGRNGGITRV